MKDENLARFIRNLRSLQRKGYRAEFPSNEEGFDENTSEHFYVMPVLMIKKVERKPEGF